VRHGGAPGVVGGDLPGQPRERRQEAQRTDDEGEQVAAGGAGAVRLGGEPEQGDAPAATVRQAGGASGQETGAGGGGAPASGDHLQRVEEGASLRGTGPGMREPASGQGEAEAAAVETPGEVGGQGGGGRGGGVTASVDQPVGFSG